MEQIPCCFCAKKPHLMILCAVLLVSLSSLLTYIIVKSQLTNPALLNPASPTAKTTPPSANSQTKTQLPVGSSAISPIASETTDWKTYTNTKLGYSFKYPTEWENCPSDFGGGQTDIVIYFCSASFQPFDYVWTSFIDNPRDLNFQQLVTQGLSGDIKSNFKYRTVTIGQNSAYVTRTLPAGSTTEKVYFKMPNKGYIGISYQPSKSALGFSETYSSYKIFSQILSTFKFN